MLSLFFLGCPARVDQDAAHDDKTSIQDPTRPAKGKFNGQIQSEKEDNKSAKNHSRKAKRFHRKC